jgi:HSP20 family protein
MRLIPYVRRNELPSRIWQETPSLFDDFLNDTLMPSLPRVSENWLPAVDVLEKDGNLILRAEIPGMNEKDIDLKLEGSVLTLKGEKRQESQENRDNYHRMESYYGSFSRSFTLPESADRDQIKADYKNGILTITIPQKPEVRPREIPVAAN